MPSGEDGGQRRFEAEEDVVVLEQRMRCLARVAIAGEAQSVEWNGVCSKEGEDLLVSRRLFSGGWREG